MFGMGIGELVVIAIVALLVLGPDKIPEAAQAIGKGLRELRKQTRTVQETLESDEQLSSTVREIKSALRGDDPVPSIKPPAAGKAISRVNPQAAAPTPAAAAPVAPTPAAAAEPIAAATPTATTDDKDPGSTHD